MKSAHMFPFQHCLSGGHHRGPCASAWRDCIPRISYGVSYQVVWSLISGYYEPKICSTSLHMKPWWYPQLSLAFLIKKRQFHVFYIEQKLNLYENTYCLHSKKESTASETCIKISWKRTSGNIELGDIKLRK